MNRREFLKAGLEKIIPSSLLIITSKATKTVAVPNFNFKTKLCWEIKGCSYKERKGCIVYKVLKKRRVQNEC